jgi:alkylation response protein AidB-like acyl-CoA dehydrogenase
MVELTAEQRDIKMAAQEFAEKEFRDIARELDEKEEFDDRIWKTVFLLFLFRKTMAARVSAISNNA